MEPNMENCLAQVLQKDVGRRLQVGQEIIDYILDKEKSHDLEQDQTALDKMVDGIASSWVNSSNFKVSLAEEVQNKLDCGKLFIHLHPHMTLQTHISHCFRQNHFNALMLLSVGFLVSIKNPFSTH